MIKLTYGKDTLDEGQEIHIAFWTIRSFYRRNLDGQTMVEDIFGGSSLVTESPDYIAAEYQKHVSLLRFVINQNT